MDKLETCPIKEVYEKFKHTDCLLSDRKWIFGDIKISPLRECFYELWQAIKIYNTRTLPKDSKPELSEKDKIMDLSLIPIEDLIKEVESRTLNFICALEYPKEENKDTRYWYGHGVWSKSVALANVLNNDVLNNWNGELRTLQRLNERSEE